MQRITAKANKRGANNLPYLLLNYIMGRNKSQEKRKNQRKIIEKEARQSTLGRHIHSTYSSWRLSWSTSAKRLTSSEKPLRRYSTRQNKKMVSAQPTKLPLTKCQEARGKPYFQRLYYTAAWGKSQSFICQLWKNINLLYEIIGDTRTFSVVEPLDVLQALILMKNNPSVSCADSSLYTREPWFAVDRKWNGIQLKTPIRRWFFVHNKAIEKPPSWGRCHA